MYILGFRQAVEVWMELIDLDVILGPYCSVVCQPVSSLTAHWNIPTISFGCQSEALSNKDVYPTFSRSVGTFSTLPPMFNTILNVFELV